ncbi:putative ribonuclease H-like domain-containing protein, partial [Tanacetum coccineum]
MPCDHDLETLNTPYAGQSVGAEADFNNMETLTIVSLFTTIEYTLLILKLRLLGIQSWVEAMQEELLQFSLRTGIVVRNKARLVAQGYKQEEGIDYDKVFALVARVEAIRLFLVYASFMNVPVYQMDVKSAFLYGTIEEEMIIFGSTKKSLCDEFEQIMHNRFQMSSMGELTFFLGLQVKQKEDGIFISQQTVVANSTTEVEYIAASHCCKRGRTLRYPSLVVPIKVGDEAVYKELGDRMERAATTASSFEAEQDFYDKHNMVTYLQKSEGSEGFHQIIDFLNASHIHAPETSPFRITSSPSLSPQHTPVSTPSTSQPSNTQPTPDAEEAVPMPYESPLHSVHSLGRDEGSLSLSELTVL